MVCEGCLVASEGEGVELIDVCGGDLKQIVRLNRSCLPHVNDIDMDAFCHYLWHADHFRVARENGTILGFLVGLGPGHDYDSPNYRWFSERYDTFLYVDRIVVAAQARGRGIGRSLYAEAEAQAARTGCPLACEVNLRPRNDASLAFHERLGFTRVGEQDTEDGAKTVALLLKPTL